ncbi:AAA family ATPase [Conexibacter woesei]|uniref:ATPase-like protein n=1 Tax=Conexibacter woesei (strain DSM 14684 / CCUG 47730 / CIP 108061 / JCM 11494 / NBRC 100937 / ID131577) TaxID=469383 RepID=D3F0F7_CONWI|nr:ATP-binding protein [Conexibacter woesei]ADB52017.1 ATPase-like protein [Conexibacter woesei DSM 14684]
MLQRIHIRGFKSLVDVELELPRLAVLAGPNAAGKSNVLDAFQMLARSGTQRTLADALDSPIRGFPTEAFTFPSGGLAELMVQNSARFEIEADVAIDRADTRALLERVRYRLGVEIDPDTGVLALADEYLARLTKDWQPKDSARIEAQDDRILIRRSGSGGRPPLEERATNHTWLSDARLSGTPYPLFDSLRAEFRQWRTYYLDPGTTMRAAAPPREVPDIGVNGEHLAPFLYGLKTRNGPAFEAVHRALKSVIPAIGSLDVDLDTKRGTLDIQIEQDGTTFSSRVVSEGTLRVLALCAIAVTARSGLVAFEEPENGVQPQRLDRIAELLASVTRRGSAQLVVTTHSPGFVAAILERARDAETDIGLFSVGRSGHKTVIRPHRDFGLWQDQAVDELLIEPDESDKISALVRRGWLDV